MKKLAVFASGSGSNFQSILDAIERGKLDARVALLVCDKPGAYVLKRAEQAGIPAFVFNAKEFENKAAYEEEILQHLQYYDVGFIALAGYMRLIGMTILGAFSGKIVNIHPSLLPAFPGKDAVGQALAAGVKITGVTIHYVDEGMDTGPIIAQEPVQVMEGDDHDSLLARIQKVEHTLYPDTLAQLFKQ